MSYDGVIHLEVHKEVPQAAKEEEVGGDINHDKEGHDIGEEERHDRAEAQQYPCLLKIRVSSSLAQA